jgi:hypothetical protein
MKRKRRRLRRFLVGLAMAALVLFVSFLAYFPGQQTPIALTLATGIGVPGLQARVGQLEEKAIRGEEFTEEDRRFLRSLYTCLAKGGRLTIVRRQAGQMMHRYLSKTGEDLRTAPRIFVNSRPVQEKMRSLKQRIALDLQRDRIREVYFSGTFYMGDPKFPDSLAGLYFGRLIVRPRRGTDKTVLVEWRAETSWEWPSYEFLLRTYGNYHAQCFPVPNARSWMQGRKHCLHIDDGLGAHLAKIGLAKPFLVYSEWKEAIDGGKPETRAAPRNGMDD